MPPRSGLVGTLVGVARWVGRNHDLVPGQRSSTRVLPAAHHPAAGACTMKVPYAYSHRPIVGGMERNLPQEAPEVSADAVLHAAGSGT